MIIYATCEYYNEKKRENISETFKYEVDPKDVTFHELYEMIDEALLSSDADICSFTRLPRIVIGGEAREPLEGATIESVTTSNSLGEEELHLFITYAGIGASEVLGGKIKLEIREKEDRRHKPHVHVSIRGQGEVSIIIGNTIEACKIVAGKRKWEKYKRQDRNDILALIVDNSDAFLSFYNDYKERYIKPKRVEFVFRGQTYYLNHGNCVYMD